MSYVDEALEKDELVVYRARVSSFAYISAIIIVALSMWPGQLTALGSTQLGITNKRVRGKTGMFNRKYVDLKFSHIEFVRSQQGGLGKIFNYGTLIIVGKEGSRVKFKGIVAPREIEQKIEEAIELAVLGRSLPGEDRSAKYKDKDEDRLAKYKDVELPPLPAHPAAPHPSPAPVTPPPLFETKPRNPDAPISKEYKDPNVW